MKKIAKFCIISALCCMFTLSSLACDGGGKEKRIGYGYGLVYNSSSLLGVKIETTGSEIDSVEMDEVGLIKDWARKSEIASGDVADEDWQTVVEGETAVNYAKKVQIGDKIFTCDPEGKYSLADGTQFTKWIEETENAKFYWQRMKAGDFHILKSDLDKYMVTYSPLVEGQTTEKSKRFFKSQNGYWQAGGHGLGYKANIKAIEDFIKAKGTDFNPENAKKTESGTFEIGGVDTGATLASFSEYFAVAKKAYENRVDMTV